MNGVKTFEITVKKNSGKNKDLFFKFDLKRNITILQGDSATGKTTLLTILNESLKHKGNPFIIVNTNADYYVHIDGDWERSFKDLTNHVIFIEESNDFVFTHDFARFVRDSGNYFVIVNREPLYSLTYSVNEIYEIDSYEEIEPFRQVYHFTSLYSNFPKSTVNFDTVITEDSNAGFDFFTKFLKDCSVEKASGNTKLRSAIENSDGLSIYCIVDGAAFGCRIGDLCNYIDAHLAKRVYIWMPESFEWILLKAGVFNIPDLDSILDNPSSYIECSKYCSWERFFTHLASKYSNKKYKYDKDDLDVYYTSNYILKKVKPALPKELQEHSVITDNKSIKSMDLF